MTGRVRRVRVCGCEVRVAVRPGNRPGRPLVLCNGIGASLDVLEPFVAALPADLEVVSFDVPGVGGSPLPPFPYGFPALAVLVVRLLDQLGYDDFDVLGISWGGALAQQVALQYRRRCRRVVLVSTATGMLMVPAPARVLRHMVTPRRYRDPGYAVRVAPELYGGALRHDPTLAQRLLSSERLGSRRGYVLQLLAGVGWTSLPFLPLIRQPTLVLSGTDDPIIRPVNARLLARLLSHARLRLFDDGHLALVTRAAELAPVVAEFLRE
jgi:poly(3-hydroxyalkanoate) depolymerase